MTTELSASRTAACVLLAMLVLGVADNLIRLIAEDIGLHQFHFLRSIFAVAVLTAVARIRGISLTCVHKAPVVWRGLLVGLAMYLYFAALAYLPIGTVVAGLFTAPVFVLLINIAWFKHPIQSSHVLAVAIGFIGMVFITSPDEGGLSLVHTVPILAGMSYACANVVAREYCQSESTVVLALSVFTALGVFGGAALIALSVYPPTTAGTPAAFVLTPWRPLTTDAVALTVFHALAASLAIGLLTFAYQYGLSTRVAVLEYVLLVFVSLFAWLFWQELPSSAAVLGMGLIAVSGFLITARS